VFDPQLNSVAERTDALAQLLATVANAGALPRARGEWCRVDSGWGTPVLANVDRAYLSHLGVRGYGVHVNGTTKLPDGTPALWIAKRALDRTTAPGKLDNIVAGGLPAGVSPLDNVIKEAAEEAGIPPALAAQASAQGQISYAHETTAGLKVDTLFLFDLAVPDDFTPHNHDGEVAGFERVPLAEVARLVRSTNAIKRNCNLVMLAYLYRQQALDLTLDGMDQIAAALRAASVPI
jgi:8-oxo-dGTP pyrophosphatase MutT (NUDIX family)